MSKVTVDTDMLWCTICGMMINHSDVIISAFMYTIEVVTVEMRHFARTLREGQVLITNTSRNTRLYFSQNRCTCVRILGTWTQVPKKHFNRREDTHKQIRSMTHIHVL